MKTFSSNRIICLWLLIISLYACNDSMEQQVWNDPASRAIMESLIEKGSLLNEVVRQDCCYAFYFETDTLLVPSSDILSIKEEPENWRTIVTFLNNYDFYIPSFGTSLDHIIEKISVNPSGCSPLTASVKVQLPIKGRVRVIVHGKEGTNGTVEYLYNTYDCQQDVTILGLYADYNNQVDLVFTDINGKERGKTHLDIQTSPLNDIPIPHIQQMGALPEKMEPGMTLINYLGETDIDTHCPFMLDSDGEIRWILALKKNPDLEHLIAHCGFQRLKNGNFITGDAFADQLVEIDMLGTVVNRWNLKDKGYSFHHEVTETEDGNLLATVSRMDARLPDGKSRSFDYLIELDPKQDKIIKEWDLASMLDIEHYKYLSAENNPSDWAHNNAVCKVGNSFIVSMRNIGIMKFDYSGNVQWILSPHKGWKDPWQKYLLFPLDKQKKRIEDQDVLNGVTRTDDFDWSWGAHCPLIMPNGNLLVFDNGFFRRFEDIDLYSQKGYSRAVEYHINESDQTIQQIWQYGEERKRSCYSVALSSVAYLPQTNHVLFAPGVGTPNANGVGGKVIEVDYKTKEVVYEVHISTSSFMAFHRASRLSLYPENL